MLLSRKIPPGMRRAERRTKKPGFGLEFADHRLYHAGDDLRRLDVNVYQRHDKLLLRLSDELEDLSVDLVLDRSLSMGFGGGAKLICAKRVTAALAYVALSHLDRVSVTAVSDTSFDRLPAMRGKGGIFKVFRFLEAASAEGATDLRSSLEKVAALRRRRGTVVVVSDLLDPAGFEGAINALRFHQVELLVVHVRDAADRLPMVLGDVRVEDSETGEARDLSLSPSAVRRVEEAQDELFLRAERFCRAGNVPYVSADASHSIEELVLRVFRTGMFLGSSSSG